MFLHVGDSLTIRKKDIVGIFDIDGTNTPEATKNFLRQAEKNGDVFLAGSDLPKSFILINENNTSKVIFSHISAKTLAMRAEISQI